MTPRLRRAALLVVSLACAVAHAEDPPLPRGALARLISPRQPSDEEDAPPETRGITHVALSHDGRALVAALDDGPLFTWDVASPTPRVLPARHGGDVTGVVWSPTDADVFASCSSGADVRLWSYATGTTLPLPIGRTHGDGNGPAFSPDGRWLLVGAQWGAFAWWEVATGRRVLLGGIGRELDKTGAQYRVAWSPDGALVATAHGDGAVRFVPLGSDDEVDAHKVSAFSAHGLSWSPDGANVCVVAGGGVVLRGRDGASLASRAGKFTCGEHSPAARIVAAGDRDGVVHLLAPPSLDEVASVAAHHGEVLSLAFSADGRRFATGGADGRIVVWDVTALAGKEPEAVARAKVAYPDPGPAPRRRFPPEVLRPGRAEGLAAGEKIEPYAGDVPGARPKEDDVRAVLVVDGTSGLPLPGATVAQFDEDLGGPPAPAYATSTTDGNGIAFAVYEPGRNFGHWLITHEGFSPCLVFSWERLPRTVVLQPRADAVGRVLDPYGKPLAGADVEYFAGCGHSPALARGTTGDDGVFRLRACATRGGNLVAHAPGVSAEYLDANVVGALGDEPVTYVLTPGADVRGRVVDADGWGVAGVGVKAGPERTATRTGADGTFVLKGVASGDEVRLTGQADIGEFLSIGGGGVDWARPDLPLTITLPLGYDDPEFATGPGVPFDVLLLDRDSGEQVPQREAVLVSQTSGYRFFPEVVDEDEPSAGALRFTAPAGAYLLVPGLPFSSHAAPPFEVRVASGQDVPLIVRAAQQPRLALTFDGGAVSGVEAVVVAGGQVFDLDDPAVPKEVHVPADGPAAVVLRAHAMQRAFPVGPESNGVREAVIAWPRPKRIVVRGVVGREPELGDGEIDAELAGGDADAGTCEIATFATGNLRFVLEDDGDGHAVVEVVVSDEPGATVEAQVRRVPRTTFALRRADGKPLVEGDATHLSFSQWSDGEGTPDTEGGDTTNKAGDWDDVDAGPGNVLEIHPKGWVPRRVVVRRDGEQLMAWGDATLFVEVADDAGKPLDAVLLVDGTIADAKKGRAELRGMDAGRRLLLVGAAGCQAQQLDVSLARGASRTIRVVLPEAAK